MVRIGILLTSPKREQHKAELLSYTKDLKEHPWNKDVPEEFIMKREWHFRLSKYGIPQDFAVANFIKHTFEKDGVEVDFILPHEVSEQRLAANDLNFCQIYELLESFHIDQTKDKEFYNVLVDCFKKAKNIFPPLDYQEFIYSKARYYKHMQDNDINILPTLTMLKEEYLKMGHKKAVQHVMEHVQSEDWGRFIAKPVGGQEAKDVKFFDPEQAGKASRLLSTYLTRNLKKYPGMIFQKAIRNFGNNSKSPEVRMFFTGDEYQYSMSQSTYQRIRTPTTEGGNLPVPMDELKRVSRRVVDTLPPIVMPDGTRLPRLTTRVDLGVKINGKVHPFVNEVEFAPSFFVEGVPEKLINKTMKDIGKQIVKITKLYMRGRKTVSTGKLKRKLPTRAPPMYSKKGLMWKPLTGKHSRRVRRD